MAIKLDFVALIIWQTKHVAFKFLINYSKTETIILKNSKKSENFISMDRKYTEMIIFIGGIP